MASFFFLGIQQESDEQPQRFLSKSGWHESSLFDCNRRIKWKLRQRINLYFIKLANSVTSIKNKALNLIKLLEKLVIDYLNISYFPLCLIMHVIFTGMNFNQSINQSILCHYEHVVANKVFCFRVTVVTVIMGVLRGLGFWAYLKIFTYDLSVYNEWLWN